MRISSLSPLLRRWIVASAERFEARRPMWTYAHIARNLWRSRRVKLSRWAVKRVVVQDAPGLAQRRAAVWKGQR